MEVDKDHIHLLVESEPKVSVLEIVRWLKQISTYQLWQKHSIELKGNFGKNELFGVMDILPVR
jgi:putative transposase